MDTNTAHQIYVVEVLVSGTWRPGVRGTLNQTSESDRDASAFDDEHAARAALAVCESEAPGEYRVRGVDLWADR